MGLFGKIDEKAKVNTWLLTIISLVPFAGIYSFTRIKKFRKMFAINITILVIFLVYLLIRYNMVIVPEQILLDSKLVNYVIIPIIDAFFVWKWCKEWNQKIRIENT